MSLTLTQREVNGVTIIQMNGRITLGGGCDCLAETLGELVAGGRSRILLNLADVSFVDSYGIGMLIKCLKVAKKHGGAMKLLHLPAKIRHVLELTHVYSVFEVFSDEQVAMQSFQ